MEYVNWKVINKKPLNYILDGAICSSKLGLNVTREIKIELRDQFDKIYFF